MLEEIQTRVEHLREKTKDAKALNPLANVVNRAQKVRADDGGVIETLSTSEAFPQNIVDSAEEVIGGFGNVDANGGAQDYTELADR